MRNISAKAATELSACSTVMLGELEELTPDVAEGLSKTTQSLQLPKVSKLSKETCQKLSAFKESITLGNLDNLDDESFELLAENKKSISFHATLLTPRKAKALSQCGSISIEDLKTMDAETAKCFKGYKGDMYLGDLSSLTPEAAKELRKLRSHLRTHRSGEYALSTGL
jgi:hypothetical protein